MISPEEAEVIYKSLAGTGFVMTYYEFSTGTMEVEDRQGKRFLLCQKHSSACSNQNPLSPLGSYLEADVCDCKEWK
jgi:hypothetical protein